MHSLRIDALRRSASGRCTLMHGWRVSKYHCLIALAAFGCSSPTPPGGRPTGGSGGGGGAGHAMGGATSLGGSSSAQGGMSIILIRGGSGQCASPDGCVDAPPACGDGLL